MILHKIPEKKKKKNSWVLDQKHKYIPIINFQLCLGLGFKIFYPETLLLDLHPLQLFLCDSFFHSPL